MMTPETRRLLEQKKRVLELARKELRAKEEEVRRHKQLLLEMERDLHAFEAAAWRR